MTDGLQKYLVVTTENVKIHRSTNGCNVRDQMVGYFTHRQVGVLSQDSAEYLEKG